MNIGNKEAQNLIKGALTCCGTYLPAGETCGTCGGAPKLYCSCIRCNEKCETKTFTAVPAVEKKKLRSKTLSDTRLTECQRGPTSCESLSLLLLLVHLHFPRIECGMSWTDVDLNFMSGCSYLVQMVP